MPPSRFPVSRPWCEHSSLDSASRITQAAPSPAGGHTVIPGSPSQPGNQARDPGIPHPLECPFILVDLASSPCGRNEAGVGLFSRQRHQGRLLPAELWPTEEWSRVPFQSTPGESTPDQRQLLGDSAITPLPPLSGTKSLDHNITLPRAWHKQASLESTVFERE